MNSIVKIKLISKSIYLYLKYSVHYISMFTEYSASIFIRGSNKAPLRYKNYHNIKITDLLSHLWWVCLYETWFEWYKDIYQSHVTLEIAYVRQSISTECNLKKVITCDNLPGSSTQPKDKKSLCSHAIEFYFSFIVSHMGNKDLLHSYLY